nr:hypothetical protein [Niallia taxi]
MLLLAAKLGKVNVRQYIDEVKQYIGNPQVNPFFQSMLLNILTEPESEQPVLVRKMDREPSVVPNNLQDVRLQEQTVEIIALPERKAGASESCFSRAYCSPAGTPFLSSLSIHTRRDELRWRGSCLPFFRAGLLWFV